MEMHEDVVQLGHEDDEGLGELLLDRLLAGTLSVLVEPVELLDDDELATILDSEGSMLTVVDADGQPAADVAVLGVQRTTWGSPAPELVAGEGYGDDVAAWRRFAGPALDAALDGGLDGATELLVQRIEVVTVR